VDKIIWTPEMTKALIHGRVNGKGYVELAEIIGVNMHAIITKCNELGFLPLGRRGRPGIPEEARNHIIKLLRQGLKPKVIEERTGYSKATISRIKDRIYLA